MWVCEFFRPDNAAYCGPLPPNCVSAPRLNSLSKCLHIVCAQTWVSHRSASIAVQSNAERFSYDIPPLTMPVLLFQSHRQFIRVKLSVFSNYCAHSRSNHHLKNGRDPQSHCPHQKLDSCFIQRYTYIHINIEEETGQTGLVAS